jgi:DNA-binding phage protein
MVVIVMLAVVVALIVILLLGMCKVASDSDDASDAIYASLKKKAEPPAAHIAQPSRLHTSVQRAMGIRTSEDLQ